MIVIDFLHTLAYKGMGVFIGFSANQPTQLWVLGRILETIGLSSIALKRINKGFLLTALLLLNSLGIYLIFQGSFPDCFIDGKGLTSFKILSEYIIILILIPVIALVYRSKELDLVSYREPIMLALILTMLAEASFTLYTDVYGFFNMLGHLLRFISYLVILLGVVIISIRRPLQTAYARLVRDLQIYKESAIKDPLTGVYNRRFFEERPKELIERLRKEEVGITIAMADIDNFKLINDRFGHPVGDRVLRRVGENLKNTLRSGDIIIRYGGDEFLIFLVGCDSDSASKICDRVKDRVKELSKEFGFPISISLGFIEVPPEERRPLKELICIADKGMFEAKAQKEAKSEESLSPRTP